MNDETAATNSKVWTETMSMTVGSQTTAASVRMCQAALAAKARGSR